MKKNQQPQAQRKLETLFSELRQDFVSASNHAESFRRDFEFQKAVGKLRKLVSGLNEQELETLLGGITESLEQEEKLLKSENKRVESEISAKKADLARIEAEQQAFNSEPDVIKVRGDGEKLKEQIENLTGEIAHTRKLESLLVGKFKGLGIDPNWQPPIVSPSGQVLFDRYKELLSHERAEKVPTGTAAAFMRRHEAELRAYSKSLPGSEETR